MANDSYLDVHVGELEGTWEYYKEFIKKHPTYDTIKSDYITEDGEIIQGTN